MSFYGTVNCRYCGESGHNRRTCPKVKQNAALGKPTATAIHERNQVVGHDRRCLYCRNSGHNKTTCKQLQQDKIKCMLDLKEYRTNILSKMKQFGIGFGAMVAIGSDGGLKKPFFITNIHWEKIGHKSAQYGGHQNIEWSTIDGKKISSWELYLNISYKFFELIENERYRILATSENIELGMPDKWKLGIAGLHNFFDER